METYYRETAFVRLLWEEQWKECKDELKLRLKENLQTKIVPAAKAYGMKKAGPKTFLREKDGLIS